MTSTVQSIPASARSDRSDSVRVVTLPERFDAFADIDLRATKAHCSIVVDARSVRFADRHSLQSLVDARLDALDAGGDLVIGAPSLELRAILELTGFGLLLSVVTGGAQ